MTRPYPTEKSLSNLRPFNKQSDEERKRANSNGGKKCAETKKRQRECAEVLKLLLDKVYKDKKGAKADGREVLMVSLFNKAVKQADIPAMKLVLSLIGEMPTPELSIKSEKEEKDNGMLEGLLQANLEIQKKAMEEKGNGQTGTENTNADCELA